MVFHAEKLLMSNSCEIKWAIDNNSFNNKNNFIKNAFNQMASFFSSCEGLVSHCPSGHSLNPPLGSNSFRATRPSTSNSGQYQLPLCYIVILCKCQYAYRMLMIQIYMYYCYYYYIATVSVVVSVIQLC